MKDLELNPLGLKTPDLIQLNTSIRSRFNSLSKFSQNASATQNYDSDEYLSELLEVLKIRTLVVGVGGAGNNIISSYAFHGIR